jgi:hypothetical protein
MILGALLTIGLTASAAVADDCAAITEGLTRLHLDQGSELVGQVSTGKSFKTLYRECDTTNRFGGLSLPSSRKCSTDPNHVEFVKKFPEGTIVFRSKMSVDADGSPASMGPNHSPTDQPETWLTFDSGSDRHFVNAEDVPFVVVPLKSPHGGISFQQATGAKKGDLAVIAKGGKCSFGLVGDAGPYFRLGEGSIRAHLDLGNEQCKVPGQHPCQQLTHGGSGSGIAAGVTYMIFPGTRPSPLLSQTVVSATREQSFAKARAFLEHFAQ